MSAAPTARAASMTWASSGPSRQRLQHLGQIGLHPLALAGSEDHDAERHFLDPLRTKRVDCTGASTRGRRTYATTPAAGRTRDAAVATRRAQRRVLRSFWMACSCAEMAGELGFGGRDSLLLRARADGLFRRPLCLEHLGLVEVRSTDRRVRKHVDVVGLHLEEAALHVHQLFLGLARHLDAHGAGLDLRDQRRVARVDAELAHRRRAAPRTPPRRSRSTPPR